MGKTIGRFEILRELGRGAQSVVYLARDPHLQREVAIKTVHFSEHDAYKNKQLLAEARTVSQLRHPNIVPIFEAGEEGGDPYLVFEYVPGKNLVDYLKQTGKLTPSKAISVIRPVMDAIVHAHSAGIIHRDIKPSNILMDEEGMPRVMDFGIALRVESESPDAKVFMGTPAYMAPEYFLRRESTECSDTFSLGLVFYELLVGHRAVTGKLINELMRKITHEDIRLTSSESADLDDDLLGILYKSLERDPSRRYNSVAEMKAALDQYLAKGEEDPAAADVGEGSQSTIEFLLRRMKHKSDFPALSASVSTVNKIAGSEKESLSKLSGSILRDFSLTNKILRLVNSAFYRQAGAGNISTISRAVMVLGFNAIRNIAITVLLFEHIQNKTDVTQLKDEFLRANFAGILAKDICEAAAKRDSEQIFICAMFCNLGRLLCYYYFPEEVVEIKRLIDQKGKTEDAAALQVLGVTFEELGIGIARSWGFPNLIVSSIRRLPEGKVKKANLPEESTRVFANFANEVCTASLEPEGNQSQNLQKILGRYSENVSLSEQVLRETVQRSVTEIMQFASVIGLNVGKSLIGRTLKALLQPKRTEDRAVKMSSDAGVITNAGDTVLDIGVPAGAPGAVADFDEENGADAVEANAEAILMAGIQDISNTLVEDFKLNDVLRIILETLYRAKGFRRVILCVRDAKKNTMTGRIGYGPDAMEVARRFDFSLSFSPDIFHAALAKNVDILIKDTDDPKIASRIPEWYRQGINAGTFVIFPLRVQEKPVAMIYADGDSRGEISIPEKELSLMRTLRNQALLALKQSS